MRNSKGVTSRALWTMGLLAAMLTASLVGTAQVAGAAPNPTGNNGTIKIDDTPFDDLPNNEPHVGCTFQVDFYGYDQGRLFADVRFEAHKPTLSPSGDQVLRTDRVFIGEDSNAGGGSEAGLDASRTYTLTFGDIVPHKIQGFHVKLTIHAQGSRGADVKHKVFWVTGCEAATTTTTTVGATTTTAGGGGGGGLGGVTSTSLLGGGALPFTGANFLPMLATGLLLVLVGVAGLVASRRMRAR